MVKILWVDDEVELLKPHVLFLQQKGYEVDTCNNGYDAIDMATEGNYDLIILDEMMPGMTGLETLPKIKEIRPTTPVIMVTKSEEENIMDKAVGSKIADYLIKPVFFQRLHASLERFMRFIHTVQQVKVVDQHALDRLFHLPAAEASVTPSTKGIEPQTLERIKRLFAEHPDSAMSVEEVVENVGISKTTGRRYLEYCVESGLISIEMLYGNIGHPRRLYRKAPDKP